MADYDAKISLKPNQRSMLKNPFSSEGFKVFYFHKNTLKKRVKHNLLTS